MPAQTTNGDATTKAHDLRIYEDSRTELRELLAKREKLRAEIIEIGETLERQEAEYVDNNPTGNILQGWDGLLKGGSAEAKRRRTMAQESIKLFSRSHISYNPQAVAAAVAGGGSALSAPASSATSTPAPTPHSTSLVRGTGGGESGAGTPVSVGATSTNKSGKRSKKQQQQNPHDDDSETDHKETKKARGSGTSSSRKQPQHQNA